MVRHELEDAHLDHESSRHHEDRRVEYMPESYDQYYEDDQQRYSHEDEHSDEHRHSERHSRYHDEHERHEPEHLTHEEKAFAVYWHDKGALYDEEHEKSYSRHHE